METGYINGLYRAIALKNIVVSLANSSISNYINLFQIGSLSKLSFDCYQVVGPCESPNHR
jgi:hypothetical protein